jgi:hypothetical protein
MKPFRIVITKAGKPSYWYANSIGEEFDVVDVYRYDFPPSSFIVNNDGETESFVVSWCDCELVVDEQWK